MTKSNKGGAGRGAWFLATLALLLLPWPAGTQGYDPQDKEDLKQTGKVAAGAAGAINPVFGKVVGVFFEIGEFVVFFGQEPNEPEVFKRINARLDALDARMAAVEEGVLKLQNQVYENANLARVRQFRGYRRDLQAVIVRLEQKPRDKDTRVALASDAQGIAGEFLADRDLWIWSDLALEDYTYRGQTVKAGQLFQPSFQPWPAMEYYALALTTWMAAIESAGDGNRTWVRDTYDAEIRRHIAFLSVTSTWNPFADAPKTLPEQVRTLVRAVYVPGTGPPINMQLHINEYTEDLIRREVRYVQSITYPAANQSDRAQLPEGLRLEKEPSYAADVLQREKHATGLMWILTDHLTSLETIGRLPGKPFIGTFPLGQTIVPAFLYGVRPDGRLTWHRHDGARVNQSVALKVAAPSGSGWDSFRQVLPGGGNVIYAITRDGKLLWYRHNGFQTGARQEWEGGREIGSGGWADFTHVFSGGGDGVIYAITRAGKIVWYRHVGHASGARAWAGGKEIGSGWGDFKHVFSGGEGIVYVITRAGKLLWYKHLGYANGAKAWAVPTELAGGGWADFTNVFSAGDGVIYATTAAGKLIVYRHTGHRTGARTWQPGREVAADWSGFTQTLALLPGVPDVVR